MVSLQRSLSYYHFIAVLPHTALTTENPGNTMFENLFRGKRGISSAAPEQLPAKERMRAIEGSSSAELAAKLLIAPTALMQLSLQDARVVVRYMEPRPIAEHTVFIREGDLDNTEQMLLETVRVSGQIMLLVGVASLFAWLLSSQRVPQALSSAIQSVASGPILFLLLSIVVMLLLGALLDGLPAMIMLVPVLMPMAQQFNVDTMHFGIILIATIGIGLFLPPIGLGLIVVSAIARVTIAEVSRPLLPYLATMMATVLLIAFWPQLTLILPIALGLR